MRALLAEDVDVERAAALLELDASEVRRFGEAAANKPSSGAKDSGVGGEATVTPMSGRAARTAACGRAG